MAVSNIKAFFLCRVQKVWELVTDIKNYTWRIDLSKTEILNENKFIEYTEDVTAKKFIMKPFMKAFLKKQQELFISDFKETLY